MKLLEAVSWLLVVLFVFMAWEIIYGWQFAGGYFFFFAIVTPMIALAVWKILCFLETVQTQRRLDK